MAHVLLNRPIDQLGKAREVGNERRGREGPAQGPVDLRQSHHPRAIMLSKLAVLKPVRMIVLHV